MPQFSTKLQASGVLYIIVESKLQALDPDIQPQDAYLAGALNCCDGATDGR